jgi:hypothetical protein
MLVFLRSPIGRWIALTLLLPVIAALLSRISRALQRRSGHPTRTSKALLTISHGWRTAATVRTGRPPTALSAKSLLRLTSRPA